MTGTTVKYPGGRGRYRHMAPSHRLASIPKAYPSAPAAGEGAVPSGGAVRGRSGNAGG